MKILWTTPYAPWPTTSGGKLRQFNLLKHLAGAGHKITLLILAKEMPAEADMARLHEVAERVIVCKRRPLTHPRTVAAGLLSPTRPLLATVNGLNDELGSTFRSLLGEPWDIVQIEHSYGFEPYGKALVSAGQPFWMSEHNVESRMGGPVFSRLPWPASLLRHWDAIRVRKWERQVLSRAQGIFAVSEDDATEIRKISGRPVQVVANGVECDDFAGVVPDPGARRILFLGNFEYAPNVAAAAWAAGEIMPRVWRDLPDAVLRVQGFRMPEKLSRDFPDPRIEWHGFVERVQDAQAESTAFLAPIRSGGGSKLKVLEAMAAGLPVVATGEAVSGLWAEAGRDYLVSDSADGLAGQIVALLKDRARRQAIGEAARQYVREKHDWWALADQMDRSWRAPA